MSHDIDHENCDCCEGVEPLTPVRLNNRPQLPAIRYRVGTHARFKETLISSLSGSDYPALRELSVRDDDDFTIAYLDGVAAMLDVLTFYQERYINEAYLRTSGERRSISELGELIGYELSPGLAASGYLAFTVQTSPGQEQAELVIEPGMRVQSVPEPGEDPQTFETDEQISARVAWNAVTPLMYEPYVPRLFDLDVYVQGAGVNVEIGDAILIVGQERIDNPGAENWDIRVVKAIEVDREKQITRLVWEDPLGHLFDHGGAIHPASVAVQLFVMRKRLPLFGHNAPIRQLLFPGTTGDWPNFEIQGQVVDIASDEKDIVAGSWLALLTNAFDGHGSPDLPGYLELYRASRVSRPTRQDFGMSARVTRVELDTNESLSRYKNRLRETSVLAASEALPIHDRPIVHPLMGNQIRVALNPEGLVEGQFLSVTGLRQRLKVAAGVGDLIILGADGSHALAEGESVTMLGAPLVREDKHNVAVTASAFVQILRAGHPVLLMLEVMAETGFQGMLTCMARELEFDQARESDLRVSEVAQIAVDGLGLADQSLVLTQDLKWVYQRDTVSMNFNVAPASHGETVSEVLGSGDARRPNQEFVLKQAPLTYVRANTPSGADAELEVRVNELLWDEVHTLYGHGHEARVYQVRNRPDGSASVLFGDGIEGGLLPSGQTNVRAQYRKHSGVQGNLKAGVLTTILQKRLGLQEVVNPEPMLGGADAERLEDARSNLPATVLTLDRAVSIEDYSNLAQRVAGIAKAHTLWIGSGPWRGIFVTVAGDEGTALGSDNPVLASLTDLLSEYGDAMMPMTVVDYEPDRFMVRVVIKVAVDAEPDSVLTEVRARILDAFSFQARTFGQRVSSDEIVAVVHEHEHVQAVQLLSFHKEGDPPDIEDVLVSSLPVATLDNPPQAARLLTVAENGLEVELMP